MSLSLSLSKQHHQRAETFPRRDDDEEEEEVFFFETTPIYSWWVVCARRERGTSPKRAERERKSIIIFGWRATTCGGVEDQKPKTTTRGANKGDLCFETHRDRPAISPRFDDVKDDDDDDDGEFCFGRERGFKKTLEREV